MQELFKSAMPYAAIACLIALLLCLAPLLGNRGRMILAILFALAPLGLVIDILTSDHRTEHVVQVPNFFRRSGEKDPHLWVTDTVAAPPWQWHMFLAAMMAGVALLLFVRRRRPASPPNAILHAWLIFVFVLALRLGLERTAAPVEIAWGIGVDTALFVILPFFGYYCGRKGVAFGGVIGRLFICALLQRGVLVTWSYFATMHQLGTHLDTHVITDVNLPLLGEHQLLTPMDQWLWPVLIPQLVMFVPITVVLGIVLGAAPWWLGKRQAGGS